MPISAIMDWRDTHGEPHAYVQGITTRGRAVNGRSDIVAPTINSWLLAQHVPNAQLIVYPHSGHEPSSSTPDLFIADSARFLDAPTPFA